MRDSLRLPSALCALLIAFAVAPACSSASSSQTEIDAAIAKALDFATAQQDPATGEPPGYDTGEVLYTGEWLASGYAAAGLSPADVGEGGGPSLQDFLFEEAAGRWNSAGLIAPENAVRLLLNVRAAGIDPARVAAEQNLPAELIGEWQPLSGGFGGATPIFTTALGSMGLAGTPLPEWGLAPMIADLRANQHPDGGWSAAPRSAGEPSNPDVAAVAVGALCTAGAPAYDPAVAAGLAYLRGLVAESTGAVEHPEYGPDLDTTAWTVSALNACGIDPQSSAWTTGEGKTPVDHLLALQLEEGGFPFFEAEPWFPASTAHALRALAGKGFAVAPAPRQDPSQPTVRPASTVAADTPTPHVLAVELAPGSVRLCDVTAPVGATVADLLLAAKASGLPAGCITSVAVEGGVVTAIDGVEAANADGAWLVRLDRGKAAVAGQQPVGFGDLVSLRRGAEPAAAQVVTGPSGGAGSAGAPGPVGKEGTRGRRGKPGRNATIACKVKKHRSGRKTIRCMVKHVGHGRQ
jgi:hypothetical protein